VNSKVAELREKEEHRVKILLLVDIKREKREGGEGEGHTKI
jgi:hypothetical protein